MRAFGVSANAETGFKFKTSILHPKPPHDSTNHSEGQEQGMQGSIFRRIRRIRQPDPAGSAPDVKLPDRLRVAAPAAPPCPFGYGGKVAWSERKKLVKRRSNKFRRRIWQGSNPWPPDLGWSASRARMSSWGLGPCIAKSTSYKPCHSSGATDRTSWTAQDT